VDEYCNAHPLDIVGVHCTHGFNRTGFLLAAYLVEKYDYDIAAAIQTFASARPPGIYKQHYINELFRRYGDEDDEPLQAPALPDWCFDEEETDDHYEPNYHHANNDNRKRKYEEENDDEAQNEDDEEDEAENGASTSSGDLRGPRRKKKRKAEHLRMDAVFMEGVPGVSLLLDKPKVNALQHQIQDMCEWDGTGFPGEIILIYLLLS
jgi:mRNA-capping enzyme